MRTTKLLSSPSKNQDDLARINPEFIGIGKQFVQTHLQRRSIQLIQKKKSNQVSFLQKEHEMAQKKLLKKQQDLQRLKEVIARKEADDYQRERLRQKRQAQIAQQRQQNMRRRHYHQQQLRNAYLSLYEDNKDASENMRKTFNMYQNLRQSMKMEEQRRKKENAMSVSMQKSQGKRKVDSFYKSRNDIFTDNYKQKIKQQRQVANNASTTINNLSAVQSELKMKLQESNSKINQIQSIYVQTCHNRMRSNKSFVSGVSNSRINYMKNSRSVETKEEKQKESDSKLQRSIQNQLSNNKQEIA